MSREAASLLARMKTFARTLRGLSYQAPDLDQTYVSTGVQAEVSALSPGSLVPGNGVNTDTTKEEYEDFMSTILQFDRFYNSLSVTTQNNASFTQNLLQGA